MNKDKNVCIPAAKEKTAKLLEVEWLAGMGVTDKNLGILFSEIRFLQEKIENLEDEVVFWKKAATVNAIAGMK